MIRAIINNYQTQHLSKTWQSTLQHREVVKNNYHKYSDLKKAKTFVSHVNAYKPHTHFTNHGEHVIFSRDTLAILSGPASMFVQ